MEVTEKVITDILARLGKLEDAVFSTSSSNAPSKRKKLSPKEFLNTKSVTSDPQRLLVLGYYLEHFEGMERFNVRDLEAIFQAAKVTLPKNINETVNKCIARGFLMASTEKKDGKKVWHVTGTGESQVEMELNKQGALS